MMKKLFCLLALGVALSACEKDTVEEINPNLRTVTFCANFDQTRTFLVGNTLYWDENDVIGGFAQGNTNVEFETDKDQGTGYFTGQIDITNNPDPFYLYYPYQEDAKFSETTLTTVLPETQPLVANSLNDIFPMVATTSDFEELVRFRNVASVVRFTVISNIDRTIKSLTLTTTDESATIWGTGTVDMTDMSDTAEPTLVMTSAAGHNSVTLTSEEGVKVKANEATYFYVVLPAGTYTDGFTVTLSDGMNDTKAAFIKDLKLARNKLIAVKDAIPFDSNGTIVLNNIVINEITEATIYFNQETKTGEVKLSGFTNPKAVTLKLDYAAQLDNGGNVTPEILINGQPYSEDATYDFTMPVKIKLSSEELAYSVEYTAKLSQLTDTGLPVVYVYTPSEITSKDDWTKGCQIYIDAEGRKSWDGTETFEDFAQLECEFKGRGNTTWAWQKKPYAIKLKKNKETANEGTEVLGMPAHRRWVLLANLIDKSMIRNSVAFMLAETVYSTGKSDYVWTPRGHSVELVLNGEHKGNYLLCEQIKIDENRVNAGSVDKALKPTTEGGQGYLIECDRLWGSDPTEMLWWNSYRKQTNYGLWSHENFSGSHFNKFDGEIYDHDMYYDPNTSGYLRTYHSEYSTYYNTDAIKYNGYGMTFGLKDPDDGDLGENGAGKETLAFKFIQNRLTEIEQIVFNITGPYSWNNGGKEYLEKLAEYIDVDSFVDYYIINEVTMNHELNNAGSVYMYYNANDGKIYAGPVWDFDNTAFKDAAGRGSDGYQYIVRNSLWYCQLLWCDAFISKVQDRWVDVKDQMLAKLPSILTMRTYLEKSAEYNWKMWNIAEHGPQGDGADPNEETDMSYMDAAYDIYENVEARITYLDKLISGTKGHFTCSYDDID